MSASAVFREIAERVRAYVGLRYPLLKDESKTVQVKHALTGRRDLSAELEAIRRELEKMDESAAISAGV